jgi:hypothetical protein
MKISNVPREGLTKVLRLFTTASLLAVLLSSCARVQVSPTVQPSPEPSQLREWRESMAEVPVPKKGCFEASYPSKEWQEVSCTATPLFPQPPGPGPRPDVVGNTNDVSAQVPSGFIGTAIGSFDSVSGVTSESGPIANTGPAVANAYSLQINTNFFTSTVCSASPNLNCRGWQQFVYANSGSAGVAYIQYWLIKYNLTCPAGQSWNQFSFTGSTDIYCWKNNTAGGVAVPNQPITNLGNLSLTGTVSATGDSITMSTGTTVYSVAGDNAVNAAAGWSIAEFNIFGDGGNSSGGGQANFNTGSSIVPRVRILSGGTAAPICVAQGFTGETNNLNFGSPAPAVSGLGPALFFTENSAGGATSNCAAASTIGDTHLTTFGGLLYDFQASGDFVLAQVEPDFVVQTRQVSGVPTWPDASVNSAVATRMGKNMVAVCLGEVPLNIDGQSTQVDDGKSLSTPEGVDVSRRGNVYVITDQGGNSVRAEVNPSWINVSVGLGTWPAKVSGLLANADGKVDEIEARDGTVLTNPFSFEDLYHPYADSWRVDPGESLLSVCGEEIERGIPQKPFYAKDLDPQVSERTRAVCIEAGVKEGPLLDSCTLDVAVIGDDAAAQVFVGAPPPIAVGTVEGR